MLTTEDVGSFSSFQVRMLRPWFYERTFVSRSRSKFSLLIIAVGLSLLIASGCSASLTGTTLNVSTGPDSTSTGSGQPTGGSAGTIPSSIVNTGEFAENIYDAVKARNWTLANEKLASLKTAAQQSRLQASKEKAAEARLDPAISALEKAIASKNRSKAMQRSNEITSIAADLATPFHPVVPTDVSRLDYYGRELEVWVAENNIAKLRSTVQELRKTWDRLRPAVESHGGQAVAAQFDSLVARAVAAQTPGEFEKVATPILDEVDKLEKVFH